MLRSLNRTLFAAAIGGLLLAPVSSAATPEPATSKGKTPAATTKTAGKPAQTKQAETKPAETKAATSKPADTTGYDGPAVLDSSRFFGLAAVGYASAKAAPQVMSKLFCYCGCDATDNHTYLIDCFTGIHGVDCHICQEEAILGLKMHRDGTPIAEIQKTIDQQFSSKYPFSDDTATYKKYKATRLYKTGDTIAGPAPAADSQTTADPSKPPKVKPGFTPGSCCRADHKSDSKEK